MSRRILVLGIVCVGLVVAAVLAGNKSSDVGAGASKSSLAWPTEVMGSLNPAMVTALGDARGVPFYTDGEAIGMRIFAIKPGSLWEQVGLQKGDIILGVEGLSVTNTADFLRATERLIGASPAQPRIEITRGRERLTLGATPIS